MKKPITLISVRDEIFHKPDHFFPLINASVCNRGFPPKTALEDPEVAKALEILVQGNGKVSARSLEKCVNKKIGPIMVENGWVHPEQNESELQYIFVTGIHQW